MHAAAARDLDALLELSSLESRPLFEAEFALQELALRPLGPSSDSVAELRSLTRDGDRAVAVLDVFQSALPEERQVTEVHLILEGDTWGVLGVGIGDGFHRLADRVPEVQEQLANTREMSTPHPDLAPPIKDYLAAAAKLDRGGMTAVMTSACAATEVDLEHSVSADLLVGRVRVAKWHFLGHGEVTGDSAEQLVLGLLLREGTEPHVEPLIFRFERVDDVWRVAALELPTPARTTSR